MKSEVQYPKEVPILTEDDFCQNQFTKFIDGRRIYCLLGWIEHVFKTAYPDNPVYRAVLQEAKRKAGKVRIGRYGSFASLTSLNDFVLKKKELPVVWNRAMRKIGYTEVCCA